MISKMKKTYRHIGYWLCSILMLLLCQACGSSEQEVVPGPGPDNPNVPEPSSLEIYVYTPEHPVVSRGDTGFAEPEEQERVVHSLDIWVFEHATGDYVGHLSPNVSSSFEGGTYQLSVTDDFAKNPPNVDVFVMVNVSVGNTGLNLGAPSRNDLLGAKILHNGTQDFFGVTTLTTEPSEALGLPMSGVLIDQPVVGNQPLLKVEDKVKVQRIVSKVRFVFSRTDTGEDEVFKITGIKLDNGKVPKAEYLFLNPPAGHTKHHVDAGAGYESGTDETGIPLVTAEIDVPVSTYPAKYAYNPDDAGQLKGQDYEELIDRGISGTDNNGVPELVQVGRYYLRESDQQMTGTISYKVGTRTGSASFSMSAAGDFSRNHTWIVYGYYAGKETLKVVSVETKNWITLADDQVEYPIPNW